MAFPYWALNESKTRKKEADYGDMPVYEIVIKYIDPLGRLLYRAKTIGNHGILSFRDLAKLVKEIEKDTVAPVRKTNSGWFEDINKNLDKVLVYGKQVKGEFKPKLVPYNTYIRSEWKEYDESS
jgi:hypothetical protein